MTKVVVALIAFLVVQLSAFEPHPAISVQRTKDCPQGGHLVGKQCVQAEVLAPLWVCPSGTSLKDARCVSTVLPRPSCPEGFDRKHEQCIHVTEVPLSYTCNEGELHGSQCRSIRQLPAVCPDKFDRRGSECIQLRPPQKVCPSGYELSGKECSSFLSFKATPVCPVDFTLSADGQCSRSIPVPPRCPDGFGLHGEVCTQLVSPVPADCPAGFAAAGTTCHRTNLTPPQYSCPSDFSLTGRDQCVKEVPVPPTCPEGAKRGASGACQRTAGKVPQCDADEELVGEKCRSKAFFVSDLQCPTDYSVVHGKCKRVTAVAHKWRCVSGALDGNTCVKRFHSVPSLECQQGYRLVDGPRCVREVAYDCSKPTSHTECEMPEFVSELTSQGKIASGYKSKATGHDHVAVSKGETKSVSKAPRCSTTVTSLPETCIKSESVPVSHVCPAGSTLEGTQCITTTAIAAEPHCAVGDLDAATGRCISINVIPSTRFCSIGMLQPDGNCLEIRARPANLVCPAGSQPDEASNGCVTIHAELVHPNLLHKVRATPSCDVGLLVGTDCRDVQVIARETRCPDGTERVEASCIVSRSPTFSPPIIAKKAPSMTCPDGTSLTGLNLCRKREVVHVDYVCPTGGIYYNGRCEYSAPLIDQEPQVLSRPARSYCASGVPGGATKCIIEQVQPAQLECDAGFSLEFDTKTCSQFHERVSVCPPGTEKTATGCIRKVYSPPQVTEVKICTKGQPNC